MRLFTTVAKGMVRSISEVVSGAHTDRVLKALHVIELVCSHAENNMFRDFPKLSGEYCDVFYGCTADKPRNAVDAMMIERTKGLTDELFRKAD